MGRARKELSGPARHGRELEECGYGIHIGVDALFRVRKTGPLRVVNLVGRAQKLWTAGAFVVHSAAASGVI